MKVEEYAIQLVVEGIVSHVADDIDEEDELASEADHDQATDLALLIARAIEEKPQAVLEFAAEYGNLTPRVENS